MCLLTTKCVDKKNTFWTELWAWTLSLTTVCISFKSCNLIADTFLPQPLNNKEQNKNSLRIQFRPAHELDLRKPSHKLRYSSNTSHIPFLHGLAAQGSFEPLYLLEFNLGFHRFQGNWIYQNRFYWKGKASHLYVDASSFCSTLSLSTSLSTKEVISHSLKLSASNVSSLLHRESVS